MDIGVSESGSGTVGNSLQLVGIGTEYGDFTWQSPAASSFGSVNTGQDFSPEQVVTLTGAPENGGNITEAGGSTTFTVTLDTSDGAVSEAAVTGEFVLTAGSNTTVDFDVEITEPPASTSTPTFNESTPYTFTFPAGTADGATVTLDVTAAQDALVEGTESFRIAVQDVSGGTLSGAGTFDFDILDDDVAEVWINEIRVDDDGTDDEEFFELAGTPGDDLSALTYLVIGDSPADGSGVIETVVPLSGSIPSDGYYLAANSTISGSPSIDLTLAAGTFENGNNVTHLVVSGFTGSSGDDLDTNDDGILEVTPWADVIDAVGLVGTATTDPGVENLYYGEALNFDNVGPDGSSLPAHVYRNESSGTYQIGPFSGAVEDTPGTANPAAVEQAGFADQAGYRLLSLPITTGTPADLAEANLVQGLTGQYPTADPNIFDLYTGSGFSPIASTSEDLEPGRGFFMYFFDVDYNPTETLEGGGTSRSFDLAGRPLSLAGTTPSTDQAVAFSNATGSVGTPGLYMIGNPFDEPLDLFGVTISTPGTLSRIFQAYDGTANSGAGGYVALDGTTDGGAFIDVYQGVFACIEYSTAPIGGPTFEFDIDQTDAGATPTFYWRRAAPVNVGLDLIGETAGGAVVGDGLADLYFREGGSVGRDPIDASEIPAPSPVRAALALVEDGVRRAVRGVPLQFDGVLETPVAFFASHPGTYTVSFDPSLEAPDGLSLALTDLVSGETVEPGQSITFESGATGWVERFMLAASGTGVATETDVPELRIGTVYPNPTRGTARLSVEVDASQRVQISVYDALGRVVAVPLDAELAAGSERLVLMPNGLAPGTYVVRVSGETFVETRRLAVAR